MKKTFCAAAIAAMTILGLAGVRNERQANLPSQTQLDTIDALSVMENGFVLICGAKEGTCWEVDREDGCKFSGYIYDYCIW